MKLTSYFICLLWCLTNISISAAIFESQSQRRTKQQQMFRRIKEGIMTRQDITKQIRRIDEVNPSVVQIATGMQHTCVLLDCSSSFVKCFGYNQFGQLGYGDTFHFHNPATSDPIAFSKDLDPVKITAGDLHSCALLQDNTNDLSYVWCWGLNSYGQLGDGTYENRLSPVQVSTSILQRTDIIDIVSGAHHNCAIFQDKTFKCWGRDAFGQLGEGINIQVDMMAAGYFHTCAIRSSDKSVSCWGENKYGWGQLGDASELSNVHAKFITSRNSHTCIVQDDDSMACWGLNDYGQLGNFSTSNSQSLVIPSGIAAGTVKTISTGQYSTCATFLDSSVSPKCWGSNQQAQLGFGSTSMRQLKPRSINVGGTTSTGTDVEIDMIECSRFHSCARFVDGAAKCWGFNGVGQVGIPPQLDFKVGDTLNEIENLAVIDFGTCGGGSPPVVRASCKNLARSAGESCLADAAAGEFDGGSGCDACEALYFSIDPPGPYGVGVTSVVLTVSDGELSDTCSATMTVTDDVPPVAECVPGINPAGNEPMADNQDGYYTIRGDKVGQLIKAQF